MKSPFSQDFGIAYHPYLALFCVFNDALTIRMGKTEHPDLDQNVSRQIATAAWRYRKKIQRNLADFCAATSCSESELGPHFYNPAYSLCFGSADGLAAILLDDFDPFLRITGEQSLPIDQASLALCPTLSSLGLKSDGDSPFKEFDQLLGKGGTPTEVSGQAESLSDEQKLYECHTHGYQATQPLQVLTRFKTNGIGALGDGLLFQRALFRAMARRISRTMEGLLRNKNEHSVTSLEITEDCIRNLSIVFADLQSCEDTAVYISCQNYSVAFTLIQALRCLTYGDLVSDGDRQVQQWVRKVNGDSPQRAILSCLPRGSSSSNLLANHCFCSSYSIAGVSETTFHEENPNCSGLSEVYARLDISPGHFVNATDRARKALATFNGPKAEPYDRPETLEFSSGDYQRILVGRHDYDFSFAHMSDDTNNQVLRVPSVIRRMRALFEQFSLEAGPKSLRGTTGVLGSSSWLVIPIPSLLAPNTIASLVPTDHLPIKAILRDIRAGLFGNNFRTGALDEVVSPLSVDKLTEEMRRVRLPLTLRRTIEYLFQNFANSLGDLYLFDSVLDLYDVYRVLHQLLTVELPDQMKREPTSTLSWKVIHVLCELIDSVQNATAHRLHFEPNTELHDWAVDFRGGLNRLVMGADAASKCGIGLVRWCSESDFGNHNLESASRDKPMAGVTRLTFRPGVTCKPYRIGSVSLARLDMNVGHIFNVVEFGEYIHEAAHLIQELMYESHSHAENLPTRDPSASNSSRFVRNNEIFAETLSCFFVYGTNWESFERFYWWRYSIHTVSVGSTTKETLTYFAEAALRAFCVSLLFQTSTSLRYGIDPHPLNADLGTVEDTSLPPHYRRRFEDFLKRAYVFFVGYGDLKSEITDVDFEDEMNKTFEKLVFQTLRDAVLLWEAAAKVYKTFASSKHPWNADGDDPEVGRRGLSDAIDKCFDSGQACVSETFKTIQNEERDVDELAIVVQLISAYTSSFLDKVKHSHGLHLERDAEGKVTYRHRDAWNDFQIERGNPRPFSPLPAVRRDRLTREIVSLKSLWNISTKMRGRRLQDIVARTAEPNQEFVGVCLPSDDQL